MQRLKNYMEKREKPLPVFELKPITLDQLEKYMKRMKGSQTHGTDNIDSFSLKLAYPIIKNVILHLVNLSIGSNKF